MRIAIVSHRFVKADGQGRINYEIVRRCLGAGHQVTVLADSIADDLINQGASWTPIQPRLQRPDLLKVESFVRKADRVIRATRQNFDVVVANGYTLTEPHDLNLCQFVHGVWINSPVHTRKLVKGPYGWYQHLFNWRNAIAEKWAFSASKLVVAPSQKIYDDLCEIGVPPERVRLIYNGVELEEFHPGLSERPALGLPVEVPMALFVGDIRTPRKNLDTVLKAVALLPQLHLAVVGALERSPYPALSRELGVDSRVHFLGFRRDTARVMRSCDLFAFPSRYEAGSLVLIEALASGLPVVTAKSAGGSELVGQDCGTVLDDSEDVEGLANAMSRIIENNAYHQQLSAAARRMAEGLSWTRMAEGYLSLFSECQAPSCLS
jgi:glycosyltransferase involved in cell wall biosynthesis